jgi:hypothetical protein
VHKSDEGASKLLGYTTKKQPDWNFSFMFKLRGTSSSTYPPSLAPTNTEEMTKNQPEVPSVGNLLDRPPVAET